jgi:hypothetical protein
MPGWRGGNHGTRVRRRFTGVLAKIGFSQEKWLKPFGKARKRASKEEKEFGSLNNPASTPGRIPPAAKKGRKRPYVSPGYVQLAHEIFLG